MVAIVSFFDRNLSESFFLMRVIIGFPQFIIEGVICKKKIKINDNLRVTNDEKNFGCLR